MHKYYFTFIIVVSVFIIVSNNKQIIINDFKMLLENDNFDKSNKIYVTIIYFVRVQNIKY